MHHVSQRNGQDEVPFVVASHGPARSAASPCRQLLCCIDRLPRIGAQAIEPPAFQVPGSGAFFSEPAGREGVYGIHHPRTRPHCRARRVTKGLSPRELIVGQACCQWPKGTLGRFTALPFAGSVRSSLRTGNRTKRGQPPKAPWKWRSKVKLCFMAMVLFVAAPGFARADDLRCISTTFNLLSPNDKVCVTAFDDRLVSMKTHRISRLPETALVFVPDPSTKRRTKSAPSG